METEATKSSELSNCRKDNIEHIIGSEEINPEGQGCQSGILVGKLTI